MKTPWRIEFDEYGGYDCMTSAYVIYNCDGEVVTEIDTRNNDGDEKSEEELNAKKIAELIVNSVNKCVVSKEDSKEKIDDRFIYDCEECGKADVMNCINSKWFCDECVKSKTSEVKE